uniref:C2H2-type domain-containing protein n=1 Tax=Rhinopithecus bieti TaxID=61621 RepID=A0A2K6MGW7_RHIBE
MTMGDMKTPDFDDLLTAFDIPDTVDPKAAIESGHDDHESHMKQNAQGEDDSHPPSSSDVGVSIIVKNVRNIGSSEGRQKHGHNPTADVSSLDSYSKDGAKSLKGDMPASEVTLKDSTFSQFSLISSAEEFDDNEKIPVDDPPDKEDVSNVLTGSAPQQDYNKLKALGRENSSKTGLSTSGNMEKNKVVKREAEANSINLSVHEPFKVRKENSDKVLGNRKNDTGLPGVAPSKTKSSCNLSSCIAVIRVLSTKKAASDSCKEPEANSRESSLLPKEVNNSPRATDKSPESQNLIHGTKNPSLKQTDSPRSISSENSSKGSPSSPTESIPAIPKVLIKTIKTSSGEIKRTVIRVLPEMDLDSGKKSSEQTASVMASVTSLLSSLASAAVLSSPRRAPLQSAVMTNAVSPAELTPKQVTTKPVATAFLPVSAVKTTGSQVINLKLTNNTTVKATVISAASVQSASSTIIKAANAIQQQTAMVPASSLANAKFVPKTVHLANLNLLPQGAQATSELRQVLTKPQQQLKQAIVNAAASQPPKKVVLSLQSSVVEAFNKVLSSVNPVPVYIPNLSPPTNAGIMLPMCEYKCSECGDSFALEKSLTQHCDRWSVRIKVTLLSHACGHKEKGVVMQCSHLILKPVPAGQMIVSPSSNTSTSTSIPQSPVGASTHIVTKIQSGITGTAVSAPSTMPLDEDPSKLCRHSLKGLECNEVFQDETSLATHFQQAADTSGQKTCTQMKKHPCYQCDKSFSSSHSLCRHNWIKHKGIRKVYKHVQLMHGIKDPDLKEMTDTTNEEETEIKEDTKVPSPERKLEEPVLEFRPPRGAITQPLKKLKISVFKVHKCAVCGFTTKNLLQFHEHIPQHKSDGSSYQRRECGLCYTSHHLFIVHKLKELQPVSKQNRAGEDDQQENKPSHRDESPDDRKCRVCAKTFETEAALNTHMQTHGMAFIKSKRMSSAEK